MRATKTLRTTIVSVAVAGLLCLACSDDTTPVNDTIEGTEVDGSNSEPIGSTIPQMTDAPNPNAGGGGEGTATAP
jgi:hypothetical protein